MSGSGCKRAGGTHIVSRLEMKARDTEISLRGITTDHDQAQVNSIWAVFPECRRVFYCWWHVLRAIRTHFNTKEFPELWSLIQDWVRTTDENQFNASWKYIEEDTSVPKSVAEYITQDWLPYKDMWSAMSHNNWTIFEKGDTNMLLEAYVIF